MTSIPEQPHGPDLDALRKDIDELKETPTEELIEPTPGAAQDDPEPQRTDAPGTEDTEDPRGQESSQV